MVAIGSSAGAFHDQSCESWLAQEQCAPPASALTSFGSMSGCPMCLKPRGTFCNILIGYDPDADLRWRVYSQDANVKTMMTKAFLNTETKKNNRAARKEISGQHAAHVSSPSSKCAPLLG